MRSFLLALLAASSLAAPGLAHAKSAVSPRADAALWCAAAFEFSSTAPGQAAALARQHAAAAADLADEARQILAGDGVGADAAEQLIVDYRQDVRAEAKTGAAPRLSLDDCTGLWDATKS